MLAFLRHHEHETVLVVVNLSRFSQVAEIDLSKFAGCALMVWKLGFRGRDDQLLITVGHTVLNKATPIHTSEVLEAAR